jgi:hypothetical protein
MIAVRAGCRPPRAITPAIPVAEAAKPRKVEVGSGRVGAITASSHEG